jgi:ABC-type lipoprotein export system ATPase subunit
MIEPLVVFEALTRRYRSGTGEVAAVLAAGGCVDPGARIALMGPSGSGKTTLLHLLAGLEQPSTGRISWPALDGERELRFRQIGLAFQGSSLLAPLTVLENVALRLLISSVPEQEARRRAEAVLADLGLEDLMDRTPEDLSGGQAQRVAMARAIVGGPRLLLADEPTGQLDHGTATGFLRQALALLAPDAGALVATHDAVIADLLPQRWSMTDGLLIWTSRSSPLR